MYNQTSPFVVAAVLSFCFVSVACGGGDAASRNAANAANASAAAATPVSDANLNVEIERLERSAERNPLDENVGKALASAYVRRGNAARAAGDLRAALKDYRSALRYDEDNDDAQKASAEIGVQVEGEQTGEYGEPAPLPITPNVADDGDDNSGPAPTPQPTPSPKKRP